MKTIDDKWSAEIEAFSEELVKAIMPHEHTPSISWKDAILPAFLVFITLGILGE